MSAWRAAAGADPPDPSADTDPVRALVRQAWGIVGIGDTAGVVQWLSPSVEQVLGYRPDELVGTCVFELVHPDDRDRVEGACGSPTAAGRSSPPVTARCRHRDGTWRHLEVVFTNQLAQPAVGGVVVCARDVTEPVEAQPADPARFRHVADGAPVMIWMTDVDDRAVFFNRRWYEFTGRTDTDELGDGWKAGLHPDDRDRVIGSFGRHEPDEVDYRVRVADGSYRPVIGVGVPRYDTAGQFAGQVRTVIDVTDRRRAELIALEQSRILEAIARGASLPSSLDAIARLVDTWIPDGRAVLAIFEPEALVLHVAAAPNVPAPCVAALERFAVPADRGGIPEAVARFDLRPAGPGQAATTLVEHGFRSWWGKPIVDATGAGREHLGAVIVLRGDVSDPDPSDQCLLEAAGSLTAIAVERDQSQARLSHRALHDTLTGLPNREQALERLRRIGRHERRGGPDVAVLFYDLDRFKVLNDSMGHDAGDRLLVEVGRRLHEALRPGDLVTRFGGDEFVIVCEQLDGVEDAHALADRLLRVTREPFELDGCQSVVTASIGIAVADGRPPEALLRDADAAMYRAKEKGRDRAEVFDARLRLT